MVSSHQTDSCQSLEALLKCQLPCEDCLIRLLLRKWVFLFRGREGTAENCSGSVEKTQTAFCHLRWQRRGTAESVDQWRCFSLHFFSEPPWPHSRTSAGPCWSGHVLLPLCWVCVHRLCQPASVDELFPLPSVPEVTAFRLLSPYMLSCVQLSETLFKLHWLKIPVMKGRPCETLLESGWKTLFLWDVSSCFYSLSWIFISKICSFYSM